MTGFLDSRMRRGTTKSSLLRLEHGIRCWGRRIVGTNLTVCPPCFERPDSDLRVIICVSLHYLPGPPRTKVLLSSVPFSSPQKEVYGLHPTPPKTILTAHEKYAMRKREWYRGRPMVGKCNKQTQQLQLNRSSPLTRGSYASLCQIRTTGIRGRNVGNSCRSRARTPNVESEASKVPRELPNP